MSSFVNKIAKLINLSAWIVSVIGHLYISDTLIKATFDQESGICFFIDVDPKFLIWSIVVTIVMETWGLFKMVAQLGGVSLPLCGTQTKRKNFKEQMKSKVESKANQTKSGKTKAGSSKAKAKAGGGKAMLLLAIPLLFIIGSNIGIYISLIIRLTNANTDENDQTCIHMNEWEYQYMKTMIYVNWTILILSAIYNTWVDIFCPIKIDCDD